MKADKGQGWRPRASRFLQTECRAGRPGASVLTDPGVHSLAWMSQNRTHLPCDLPGYTLNGVTRGTSGCKVLLRGGVEELLVLGQGGREERGSCGSLTRLARSAQHPGDGALAGRARYHCL